jgi:hypothetical protein
MSKRFVPFTFGAAPPSKADRATGFDPYNSVDAKAVKDPELSLDFTEIETRVAAAIYGWSNDNG